MDCDGRHVLRGCRRISDLEIAPHSLNSNRSSNAIAAAAVASRFTRNNHVGLERLTRKSMSRSGTRF
jgi:hypothetical protein